LRWVAYEIDEGFVEVGYAVPENVAMGCLEEKCSLADAELFGQVSHDMDLLI
jgi:hypothetical protein